MRLFWDNTYILVIIGAIICGIASINVRVTFNKYNKVLNRRGLSSNAVASMIMRSAGINDVQIGHINGSLTDHYSPTEKILRLSDSVGGSTSVAAIGVAAHECGHAIQHNVGYGPLKLRSISVPVARFGSYASWPLILIGLIFGYVGIARIGVALFSLVVLFQLITLPVEFNASRRAIKVLSENNILEGEELNGAKKVLTAAAMTYVAALFSSIMQLLRLILLTRGNDRKQ